MVTFFLDHILWNTIPSFMHLENVVLHFINSLLAFCVASCLIVEKRFALLAALLFAVHPLAAESVCWISGRTDLLAGTFLLLSLFLYLKGLSRRTCFFLFLSGFFLLLSCLAKEVTVFILPGVLFLGLIYPDRVIGFKQSLRQRWCCLGIPVIAIGIYFLMRLATTTNDTGVKTVVSKIIAPEHFDWINNFKVAFKVYGFYFKKIIFPWPLNFAITQVSDWYVVFGCVLACLLFWFLWRRDVFGGLCLSSFFVLSPAIFVPLGKMAWTPLAERYLYISIALLVPVLAGLLEKWFTTRGTRIRFLGCAVVGCVLLLFFVSTLHRSWIWQDNERLFRDSVSKNTYFAPVRAELASALIAKGETGEAEQILQDVRSEFVENYIVDDLYLATNFIFRGEHQQARDLLLPLLDMDLTSMQRAIVYHRLLKLNDMRIAVADTDYSKRLIRLESLGWLEMQFSRKQQPFTAYRMGVLQLALDRKVDARKSFLYAYDSSNKSDHYHAAAAKLAEKIKQDIQ
jgi:hypothetical protein